ncbi:hypothetical protein YC2023_111477 [Brassica napus]
MICLRVLLLYLLSKVTSTYGPFLQLRILNLRIVLVSSASAIYEIFKAQDINVSSRGAVAIDECMVFGSFGFIRAPYGDYWKFMKKLIMTKVLGPQALERSRGVREVELERFYKNLLDKAKKKESVDIGEEAIRLVTNTLGKMSIGSSFSQDNNNDATKVSQLCVEFGALSHEFFFAQVFHKLLQKLGISVLKRNIMDVSRRYEDLLERILVKYEEKLDEHQGNECIDAFLADENAEYRITRKNIKALLAELFFGAGDSSASTTQWAMAEIINNPNILESLRVVGKKRLVQETDLPKLPYLQAVINETLRMHPVGAVFPREFQQECTIGGFYIAKGTTLVINAYGVMRDPDYWEDPNKFKPERFLASSGSSWQEERREQAMKFLPFGGGRRRCPGSNVAYIIVGTAIGVMVQCFDWKIKRGYEVNMEETSGLKLFLALAHPLECIPLSRTLNPLPTNLQITDL